MNGRLKLLAMMAFATVLSQAAPITPTKALEEAQQFCQTLAKKGVMRSRLKSDMQLAHTGNEARYYAFNRGENSGYVIVSGDDCSPAILGYSDSGSFDWENIPANMKAWLDGYERQVKASAEAGKKYTGSKVASHAVVDQLMTTTWNQTSPYNLLCPSSGSTTAPTGCVATAMAQVAKYHSWPVKASGKGGATFEGTALDSIDMSNDTFDWDNMLDSYDGNATSTQKNAVALLMRDIGYSVGMGYGKSASGASSLKIAPGLINTMGYDKSAHVEDRSWYTDEQWDNLVYEELANKRPVLYCGVTKANEGHEFVCDGYKGDGYYHFNWGWGGIADGYFLLSALNPQIQGTGGSSYGYAFNYQQDVTVNVQKPVSGSDYVITFAQGEDDLVYADGNYECTIYNYSVVAVNAYFGTKLVNLGKNKTVYYALTRGNIPSLYGFKNIPEIEDDLEDGYYKLTLAYSPIDDDGNSGDWFDVKCPTTTNGVLYLVVKNGVKTYYKAQDFKFEYVGFTAKGDDQTLKSNATNTINFEVAGNGASHEANLTFVIKNSDDEIVYTSKNAVEHSFSETSLTCEVKEDAALGKLTSGEYKVVVLDNGSVVGEITGYEVKNVPTYVAEEPLTVTNLDPDGQFNLGNTEIGLSIKVKDEGDDNIPMSGYYLRVASENGVLVTQTYSVDGISSSGIVNRSFSTSELGITEDDTYYTVRFVVVNSGVEYEVTPNSSAQVTFKTKKNVTGVDEIAVDDVKCSVVYDVNGRVVLESDGAIDALQLAPGIYVVKTTDVNGNVKTKKIVR